MSDSGPDEESVARLTDAYFNKTKTAIRRFGDATVTYAVFMRRPVVSAPRLAVDWLKSIAEARNTTFDIQLTKREGGRVGAGEPLLYVTGSFLHLVDLETLLLQKIGPACVAAHNAYFMCMHLPKTAFLAMDARHCAGSAMAEMMAYAAAVGSERAREKGGAVGFTAPAEGRRASRANGRRCLTSCSIATAPTNSQS